MDLSSVSIYLVTKSHGSEKSDADREAPPEGGVDFFISEFNGAAGKVGGYNAVYIDLGESRTFVNFTQKKINENCSRQKFKH